MSTWVNPLVVLFLMTLFVELFFNYAQSIDGCRLILWGRFKKVVIADSLGLIVDEMFVSYNNYSGASLILGAVGFSFQIYGDFSGYSDIALGTAKLFGFELLSNFKFPYFSRDIAEFWRRWHISLSSWFKDYLYIPLGGSKNGKLKAVKNTFIIFLLSGFWHGASWNFIAWGFIHACGFLPLLLLNRNRKHVTDVVAQNRDFPSFKELWQMVKTFAFVTFAWIFFRADGMMQAMGILKHIYLSIYESPGQFLSYVNGKKILLYIVPMIIIDWSFRKDERKIRFTKSSYDSIILILLGIMIYVYFGQKESFIYFQF